MADGRKEERKKERDTDQLSTASDVLAAAAREEAARKAAAGAAKPPAKEAAANERPVAAAKAGSKRSSNSSGSGTAGVMVEACPGCGRLVLPDVLRASLQVCPLCGYHRPLSALERIAQLADLGSWSEVGPELQSLDPLSFSDLRPYPDRVREAQAKTGLQEAFVGGRCSIAQQPAALGVLDFRFLGGSMGSVVGEAFVRLVGRAVTDNVPLVVVASSGGARMQEGIISLMQMAKTVVALEGLRESGLPFISVLADPTTGGVLASFATLADIVIAEPGAFLSFAGPRVIEQTTREKLPEGFGRAEEALAFGQVDLVVARGELKKTIATLILLLRGGDKKRVELSGPDEEKSWWRSGTLGRALARVGELTGPARRWLR